uniref:uncharacterized protein LOC122586619 n=1 Tax=Erigeron canadensis TaxID=72917 RepID=UPI001CB8D0F9|nr:uncharacterized protein LOC122586619 [Erigeron canadensis]
MEGAMNNHIAQMIRDELAANVQREFEKRDGKGRDKKDGDGEKEVEVLREKLHKKKFTYKDFDMCHPPVYHSDRNPIICTRWVSEIEGDFRTSQCPPNLKVVFAVSMLRDSAKRWWDNLWTVKGEATMALVEWSEFKTMFYKEFRSEAEVTKLRSEFLHDYQGTLSLTKFRAQFLDKAHFFPEFLENDQMLKEQFYLKLRKSLREKISLRQMDSFSMLVDVARDHEIEQSRVDEGELKRKHDESNSPNKRFKQDGGSGSNFTKRNIPFCRQCKKNHFGMCRATEKGCYNCRKPGHMSRDCKTKPNKSLWCFKMGM